MGKTEFGTIVAIVAIAAALASLGSVLASKKKDISQDDRPNVYASRGSFVPLVIGRQMVGEVILWIQPESPVGTDFAGGGGDSPVAPGAGYGKGGGAPRTQNYEERGLHALCVGPASKLHAILQNGKKIWEGPITPWSHPSGTAVNIPNEGTFRVWWGFSDDPPVDYLGAASNHGVATKYPLVMKVLWDRKSLGQVRQWPRLEYEVEVPCHSHLANTPALLPDSFDDNATRIHPTLSSPGSPVTAALPCWEDWVNKHVSGIYVPGGSLNSAAKPQLDVLEIVGGPEYSRTRTVRVGDRLANAINGPSAPCPDFTQVLHPGEVMKLFGNGAATFGAGQNLSLLFPGSTPVYTGAFFHILSLAYDPRYWVETGSATGVFNPQVGPPSGVPAGARVYTGSVVITTGPTTHWKIENPRLETAAQTPKMSPLALNVSSHVNPIHLLSQMMFAPGPYGASRDRERFDIASMEEAAYHFQYNERYRAAITLEDGELFSNAIGRLLQDIGLFISWEPLLGRNVFKLIRHPGVFGQAVLAEIPSGMLLSSPEIVNTQVALLRDKVGFTFQNSQLNYRDDPIIVDDDGIAAREESQQIQSNEITTTNDRQSAELASKRRAQETQANHSLFDLELGMGSRWMFPGLSFVAPGCIGDEVPLRVMTVQREPATSRNRFRALLDTYDPPSPFSGTDSESSFEIPSGGGQPADSAAASFDALFGALEVPRYMSNGRIRFVFPRLRAGRKTTEGRVWLSRDGDSYTFAGFDRSIMSGGYLLADLPAGNAFIDDATISILALGEDMLKVEDLSSLQESFWLGRQLCLIGNELCYLKRVESVGDNQWLISRGLARGRLGTEISAHPAGTPVFILRSHEVRMFESLLFVPGRDCNVKMQPVGPGGGIQLDSIDAVEFAIRGDAIRPMRPTALRLDGMRVRHNNGENVVLRWCYRSTASPRTGMGMQGFGDPVGSSAVQGRFRIRVYNNTLDDDIVLREVLLDAPTYTYTAANRTADGVTDGVHEWKIVIENIEAGYASDALQGIFGGS